MNPAPSTSRFGCYFLFVGEWSVRQFDVSASNTWFNDMEIGSAICRNPLFEQFLHFAKVVLGLKKIN
jgi:hypothetical protein